MPYHIEVDEALVLGYLRHKDRALAEADIDTLLHFLEDLSQTGDLYRNDPSRRCPPGSAHFDVAYVFRDAAGKLRLFRFIISDAAATYGVLRVRFAEEL